MTVWSKCLVHQSNHGYTHWSQRVLAWGWQFETDSISHSHQMGLWSDSHQVWSADDTIELRTTWRGGLTSFILAIHCFGNGLLNLGVVLTIVCAPRSHAVHAGCGISLFLARWTGAGFSAFVHCWCLVQKSRGHPLTSHPVWAEPMAAPRVHSFTVNKCSRAASFLSVGQFN